MTSAEAAREAGRVTQDAFTEVVDALRLRTVFICKARLIPPWGFFIPRLPRPILHIVTRGREYYTVKGVSTLELQAGDVVILPHGHAHWIQDALESPLRPVEELLDELSAWSLRPPPSEANEFIGISCELTSAKGNPVVDFLPHVICCRANDPRVIRWLQPTVALLEADYRTAPPGCAAILTRLCEVAFIQVIRIWLEQSPEGSLGWLRALKDDKIAAALQAIHHQADARWTVASLAARAGMSRSAFASRFKMLVGESPMTYVTRWRMQRAASMLENRRVGLKAIVAASGYSSEAAFRLGFKKWFGTAPSLYQLRDFRPS